MRKAFFLLSFFFACLFSTAQVPGYRHFTVSDGLPSSEVYSSFQDSKGYIWFATDRGVSRFDGYVFTNFTTADGLSDNTVFGFFEDHLHRLWLRSYSGTLSYIYDNKVFRYAAGFPKPADFNGDLLISLYVDSLDNIWMGTRQNGTMRLDARGTLSRSANNPQNTLYVLKKGGHQVFGFRAGTKKGGKTQQLKVIIAGKKEQILNVDVLEGQRISYTATPRNHLLGFGRNVFYFSDSSLIHHHVNKDEAIFLYADRQEKIWVCTRNGATCYRNGHMHEKEAEHYLKGSSVSSVMQDREGNYWFTTLENGVYMLRDPSIFTYLSSEADSIGKITFITLSDSLIQVGTTRSRIYTFGKNLTGVFELPGSKRWINCMLTEKNGKSWIGTDQGTYCIHQGKITGSPLIRAKFLTMDDKGRIWSAAYTSIYCLNDTLAPLRGRVSFIYSFYPEGEIFWIGTSSGLVKWNRRTGTIEEMNKKSRLFANRISAIARDRQGTLYLSTHSSGLIVWKGERILQLTAKEGLPGNICNHVYIDDENNVWVSTSRGLACIQHAAEAHLRKIKTYDTQNGLVSNEVRQVVRNKNDLWVATGNGLNVIHLDAPQDEPLPPPVYITGVSVDDTTYMFVKDHDLPYSHKYIQINFVGLQYKHAGHTRYRYKMQGLDTGWVYTSVPQAQYTTLPAGEYVFYVTAAGKNGQWNTRPAAVRIAVESPFWNKTWFRSLAVLGMAGIFYLAFRQSSRRKINRNNLMKELNEQKHKALSAQLNPHFIFNSLNSVQHYILNSEDKKMSGKYLSAFASLMRITLDNSQHTLLPLATEIEALELYLKLESMRFNNRFTYRIDIGPGIEVSQVWVPSLLFQPYVENAIWHGLLHKQQEGQVTIAIRQQGENLLCSIEDDGIGRQQAAENRKHYGKYHQPSGLSLTKKRLELINAIYKTSINVTIKDLANEKNEPAGTRIDLLIPLLYPRLTKTT